MPQWRKTHALETTNLRGRSLNMELWEWLESVPEEKKLPVEKAGQYFSTEWEFSNENGEGVLIEKCGLTLVNDNSNEIFDHLTTLDPANVQLRVFWDGKRVFKGFPDTLNLEARADHEYFAFTIPFTSDITERFEEDVEDLFNTVNTPSERIANLLSRHIFKNLITLNTGNVDNAPRKYIEVMHSTKFDAEIGDYTDLVTWFPHLAIRLQAFEEETYNQSTDNRDLKIGHIVNAILKAFFAVAGWSVYKQCLVIREIDCDPEFSGRHHYLLKGTTSSQWFNAQQFEADIITSDDYDEYRKIDSFIKGSRRIGVKEPLRDYYLTSYHRRNLGANSLPENDNYKLYTFNDFDDYGGTLYENDMFLYHENRRISARSYFDVLNRTTIPITEVGRRFIAGNISEPNSFKFVRPIGTSPWIETTFGRHAKFTNPRNTDGDTLFTGGSNVTDSGSEPHYWPGSTFWPLVVSTGISAFFLWGDFRRWEKISTPKIVDPMFVIHYNNSRWVPVKGRHNWYQETTEDLEIYNCDPFIPGTGYHRLSDD